MLKTKFMSSAGEIPLRWMPKNLWWYVNNGSGVIGEKAITLAYNGLALCHNHITPLGVNELILLMGFIKLVFHF